MPGTDAGGIPGPHGFMHKHEGGDEIATVVPAANQIPKADEGGKIADGWLSNAIARLVDLTWGNLTGKPSTFPPSSHNHPQSEVDNLEADLATKAASTDTRFPTNAEKAALAGTHGSPGAGNKYVTDSDPRLSDSRTPTGVAGGVLSGTYPNPGFAVDMATQSALDAHTSNTNNPHNVTKAQVGLGNVDDTSDADKPISSAQAAALAGKAPLIHSHPATDISDSTPAGRELLAATREEQGALVGSKVIDSSDSPPPGQYEGQLAWDINSEYIRLWKDDDWQPCRVNFASEAETLLDQGRLFYDYRTSAFTAARGGKYICAGTFTVTNPSHGGPGDVYQVIVLSGTVTICGVPHGPSRFPVIVAYNGSSWVLLSNAHVVGDLTINGSATLGDASGDSLIINAATLTAPNATDTSSNRLANVGALARFLSYKFPLTQQGENLTRSDGQDFFLNPWRGFAASDGKGMYIPPGTRWIRVRATLTTVQNVVMSDTNMQVRVFIISHNGTAGAYTHFLPDTDAASGTWPASGTLSGAWSAFSVSHPAGGRGHTYDSGWVQLPSSWVSRIDGGTVLFCGVRLRNQTGGNLTDAWQSNKPFMGQVEFSPF